MRKRLLVRHFLYQFLENEFTPDTDRHQMLAVAAAALITVPLFVTVLVGWRYLMQPLQAPGWTELRMLDDEMLFCAASMLVSAVIATLQWNALALSHQDATILGVMPIERREVVRAKMTSLVIFAAAFVAALNALPAVLHPPLMVANLPLNLVMLLPLIAGRAMSTCMAGAFGFEEDKYEISIRAGERVLLPKVREAARDTLIIADGFSCREQIEQTTDRKALHLSQVLQMGLRDGPAGPKGDMPERSSIEEQPKPRVARLIGGAVVVAGAFALLWRWLRKRA